MGKKPTQVQVLTRFMASMERSADGCWLWTGRLDRYGYGRCNPGSRKGTAAAHRWAYEHFVGPIPTELQIDHICRTPRCVNPEHLRVVPPSVNTRESTNPAALNARKTHCPAGHAYSADNTQVRYDGARRCRECHKEYMRGYHGRSRARERDVRGERESRRSA